jgi:hypothetical protein
MAAHMSVVLLSNAHDILLPQGILEPNTTTAVQVMMQAQKEYPPDMSNCKDKFLVQTVLLLPGQDLEADTFRGDVSCAAAWACVPGTQSNFEPAMTSTSRKPHAANLPYYIN